MYSTHSAGRAWLVFAAILSVVLLVPPPRDARSADEPFPTAPAELAARILQDTGVRGGLVLHLGCGAGELTAALHANSSYQVQGLDRNRERVLQARQLLVRLGVNGTVTVDHLAGAELPYIDNFLNLVVAEDPSGVPDAELLRVLAPRGVAYVRRGERWTKIVKPWPKEIDEWTHYFHGPSGNAVAHDERVAPPERLQWLGSPRWSRHHDRMASMSAMVSSGGRVFYVMDEGSRVSILLPSHWQLIARDAFNGTILWKRAIPDWHNQLWPLKSGPTQLARRLVADGDRIYVTLGLNSAVSCLDGATGEVLREYEGTKGAEELLHLDGTLVALVNRGDSELTDFAPKFNTGDQGRVGTDYRWNEEPRDIVAVDVQTGRELWSKTSKVAPLTMALDAQRVVFCDGEKVVALDRRTGRELWSSQGITRRRYLPFHFGPRLVLHQDVILFAGGDAKMRAFAAADGKSLWEAPHAASGYQSPQDVIVASGLVWCAPTTGSRDTGIYSGRDPRTGEVKKEFPPDVDTYWFHHRCYIAKATDRFLIPSRTGIEFVDLKKEHWDINHWVRGGCLYGVMPCNGLLYAPPHNCACYPEAKLYGLNVLAPANQTPVLPAQIDETTRLEQGPAYEAKFEAAEDAADWPAYRHDAARSGATASGVVGQVQPGWKIELGGRLSSPVVAGGRVYVAQVDAHTLHALSAADGQAEWTYTAGGRIDSPPTIAQGRVVFGSADGWVYCLRATSGELIWRFRAAPIDRRLAAFEQIESVWPVHGSVLVEQGVATVVAGRSCFLDGGLRYLRLDVRTGQKLTENVLDGVDPETGRDLQDRLRTLQMPVGLNDILSSDGRNVFLRSQKFDKDGKRIGLGPVSGDAVAQGRDQRGDDVHLFAPMGFLDDSWFHRSYWVYGKNFAGGHNGYYQAGKVTPSGRIMVFNDDTVFGFGRLPQYYKWTTTLEHQLFAAPKSQPDVPPIAAATGGANAATTAGVSFATNKVLDPAGKPLTISAWIRADGKEGVVVAHGGPANGYALSLGEGRPIFSIRSENALSQVVATQPLTAGWHHVLATLGEDLTLRIAVDGVEAASGKAKSFIADTPKQACEIGHDSGGAVGEYESPAAFRGALDEVRVHLRELTAEERSASAKSSAEVPALVRSAILALSFDQAKAVDEGPHEHPGDFAGGKFVEGKFGKALALNVTATKPAAVAGKTGKPGKPAAGAKNNAESIVKHKWNGQASLFARAMVLAGDTLFVAGPPDLMDEEESFEQLTKRDTAVNYKLQQQDEAWQGNLGGVLWAVDAQTGKKRYELPFESLPTWDGLAAAQGQLFLTTIDGHVVCLKPKAAP